VHESTGRYPEGLQTDRKTNAFRSFGLFDECIDTQRPDGPNATIDGSTLFSGKYCTVFFSVDEVLPEELDNRTIATHQPEDRGNWIS